jgi:hypothetical protein
VNKVFLYCLRGVVLNEDDNAFAECWKECTEVMKRRFRSVVLPIGSLSIGLCVHRALLFKVNLTTSLFFFHCILQHFNAAHVCIKYILFGC